MFDDEIVYTGPTPAEINGLIAPKTNEVSEDNQQEEVAKEAQETHQAEQVEKQADSSISRNMRALREKAERIERERDAAMRRLQEYENQAQGLLRRGSEGQGRLAEGETQEEEIRLGDDDIAEGKHLKGLKKKLRTLEDQVKGYQQQSSMMATESRLKSQYPDFDQVVNKDNIESLRDLYPEIAQTLNASTDLYATGVSAYTMIKKLGIQVADAYSAEKAIVQKNAAKPRPLASVAPQHGDSPLSKANAFANGLTEELKEQLRKEMFEARRAI